MTQFTTEVPNIVGEVFDGEVVIADFVSGAYFSLTGSGAAIWQAIKAGKSVEAIEAWLSESYPGADAGAAVEGFVGQLSVAGLIVTGSPAEAGAFPDLPAGGFAAPVLERHDDLKDLLLLDPVHDVAEAGWPHMPDKAESD